MEQIVIQGGKPLNGTIKVSGAKNSVLTIIPATLLAETPSNLDEVANLYDVRTISEVLRALGVRIEYDSAKENLKIDSKNIDKFEAPRELVNKMRASNLIIGPMLSKFGRCKIALPGGCAIGTRSMELHFKGFKALGATIIRENETIEAIAPKKGLKGNYIYLDFPSVGATENIMMAASLAKGVTIIENAAKEPEIVDLANCLNSMGSNVKGAGTATIKIQGVKYMKGVNHTIIPDRLEAGTYMIAAAITKGKIKLKNVLSEHLLPVIAKLREAGVKIEEDAFSITVEGREKYKSVDIKTLPYPGFPTDMQAQFMSLMLISKGISSITETVFENRFMHIDEFNKLAAKIIIEGHTAYVKGVQTIYGNYVNATDLRAGAAMILAGLAAKGETTIGNINHINRGYAGIIEKLSAVGANIKKINI